MKRLHWCCLLAAITFVGCGDPRSYESAASYESKSRDSADIVDEKLAVDDNSLSMAGRQNSDQGGESSREDEPDRKSQATRNRKIIYKADIQLVVDDLGIAGKAIRNLADEHDGYVASYSEDRTYGNRRTGHWVLRIPTAAFDDVMDKVGDLGVPESRKVDSEDVTAQYVDAEARLKTQRLLEEEMLALLERHDGELKDVIELERELSRIRGDIEQIEAHLRRLSDQIALTTVTIHAREEVDYEPPQAPTFATRITDRWSRSLAGLISFGQNLVVFIVGVTPVLAVLVVLITPLWLWFRLRRRRRTN